MFIVTTIHNNTFSSHHPQPPVPPSHQPQPLTALPINTTLPHLFPSFSTLPYPLLFNLNPPYPLLINFNLPPLPNIPPPLKPMVHNIHPRKLRLKRNSQLPNNTPPSRNSPTRKYLPNHHHQPHLSLTSHLTPHTPQPQSLLTALPRSSAKSACPPPTGLRSRFCASFCGRSIAPPNLERTAPFFSTSTAVSSVAAPAAGFARRDSRACSSKTGRALKLTLDTFKNPNNTSFNAEPKSSPSMQPDDITALLKPSPAYLSEPHRASGSWLRCALIYSLSSPLSTSLCPILSRFSINGSGLEPPKHPEHDLQVAQRPRARM
ncbi:hypothetical protein CDD80_5569 [Ophiocordyceps camponoti-rufipedis]|uniref:Uncharacterized protein n=1 Tax=Ophiocordyceps camponoti-rufipedis TaxID=2004952 RepID=A0A2C5YNC6_9HYPO|nr:hypothetical protein CDD80_5569 [Ophiocordyceps camponoti-rufipedis]